MTYYVGMHKGWYAVFCRNADGSETVVVEGVLYCTDAYDVADALNAARTKAKVLGTSQLKAEALA